MIIVPFALFFYHEPAGNSAGDYDHDYEDPPSRKAMARRASMIPVTPGAYTVRYSRGCGIVSGFSLAETENLGPPFLLGRALEGEGSEPFDIGLPPISKLRRRAGSPSKPNVKNQQKRQKQSDAEMYPACPRPQFFTTGIIKAIPGESENRERGEEQHTVAAIAVSDPGKLYVAVQKRSQQH
jgi:hypothetical protein